MSTDCIFCKIMAGELPASKVMEDDGIIAFLDIAPIVKGHTLVIPKAHTEHLVDTPTAALTDVMTAVRKIARAQQEGLGAAGVNLTQANGAVAGQVVPHIHFHVIPRFGAPGTTPELEQRRYENDAEREQYAAKLRAAVEAQE